MATKFLENKMDKIFLYDLNSIDINTIDYDNKEKIVITECWQDAYVDSNTFITRRVSKAPYINLKSSKGSLKLNVF